MTPAESLRADTFDIRCNIDRSSQRASRDKKRAEKTEGKDVHTHNTETSAYRKP
jgi:hypothetical protein